MARKKKLQQLDVQKYVKSNSSGEYLVTAVIYQQNVNKEMCREISVMPLHVAASGGGRSTSHWSRLRIYRANVFSQWLELIVNILLNFLTSFSIRRNS